MSSAGFQAICQGVLFAVTSLKKSLPKVPSTSRCPAVSVKGSHGLQYLLQPPKHVLIQFGRY